MPFLVRSHKPKEARGDKAPAGGPASVTHRAAVDKLARNRTRSDLAGFLLAREVERAVPLVGDGGRGLQQQRGLADAGLAAEQHGRALREAVARRAVEFADARDDAAQRLFLMGEGFDLGGLGLAPRLEPGRPRKADRAAFLAQAVPRPARRAFALPFRGNRPAGLADVVLRAFHHDRASSPREGASALP